jgi:cytochrome c556
MSPIVKSICGLVAAATIGLSGAAIADSHVDPAIAGAIKARQSHMQLYAHNLGILGAMAQDKAPYDAEAATNAANNLVALVALNQMSYWPAGSAAGNVDGTRALPAIWEDFPGVMAKVGALTDAAAAMQTAAGTDLDGLKAAMGALGGACGSCHQAYRQPN